MVEPRHHALLNHIAKIVKGIYNAAMMMIFALMMMVMMMIMMEVMVMMVVIVMIVMIEMILIDNDA